MARRKLEVVISGDASSLNRALGSAKTSTSKFGSAFKGTAAGVAAAAGGLFAVDRLVSFGSELIGLGTKTEVWGKKAATVFEDQRASVDRWASKNAEAFGLADNELTGLAANFGDLLKPMGFTAEQAAKMSTDVVGLSGALSAWTGGTRSAAEVSEILAKAMLGERDSLKELGISILDADVKARLAAKGQDKLTGAALEQAKAVATQELIFEKSADAQKAWADGSLDAVKNQNKLKSTIAELKTDIAERLRPAIQAATKWLGQNLPKAIKEVEKWVKRAVPIVQGFARWISKNRDVILPFVAALLAAFAAFKVFMFIKAVTTAVMAFNAALLANPIGLVVVAVAALVAGIIVAYQRFEAFRNIVNAVGAAIKVAAEFIWNAVKTYITMVVEFWTTAWETVRAVARFVWSAIGDKVTTTAKFIFEVIKRYVGMVITFWTTAWGIVRDVAKGVWTAIGTAVDAGMSAIDFGVRNVLNPLITAWSFAWNGMKEIATSVWGGIKTVINGVLSGIETAYNALRGFWNAVEVKVPGFNPPGPGPKFGGFTFGLPDLPSVDIPRLHTGGIFQAPGGQREGLALLESGERVSSRHDTASGGDTWVLDLRGAVVVGTKEALGRLLEEALVARGRVNGPLKIKVAS